MYSTIYGTSTIAAEWIRDPHGAVIDLAGLALLEVDALGTDRRIDKSLAFSNDSWVANHGQPYSTPWRTCSSPLNMIVAEVETLVPLVLMNLFVESSNDGVTAVDSAFAGYPYSGAVLGFRFRVTLPFWRVVMVASEASRGLIRTQERLIL